ncbi:putative O-glycosylation ligase, exosortase A system-associated [Alkalilimnicola ehrlichii MLHE-1]|uniref:O-antigen polymerase n=1 Tax=Alkalilimnicola ehrlichii (strain ATCC BAA-1101 / DSM 17681 / MLHE-1) TaxID=187272 RepID=Q0ACG3_ALKEH|nr:putative O-glycosylation ligase, exosortase A system-associated [Alkalilimnicola ehrlichii]ABI55474.1 O-antigen polymerase [Alkalilimnicola ehrlichii MLHE-1]
MRDILLALIFAGLVPVILRHAWVGIPTLFWVSLFTPQLQTWTFMHGFPAAMLFTVVTLAAIAFSKDRKPFPWTRETVMLLILAAYFAMTSHFAVNSSGAWDFWVHFMKILLVTFLTPILIHGERRILITLLVITGALAFFGLKGGIFAVNTGGAHMVLGPSGSYLSGNTYIGLAMLMVLPLILTSARLFHRQWVDFSIPLINRFAVPIGWAGYAVFWFTCAAILATHSRGAFVGMVVITPFLFLHMRKKWLLVLVAFIGVGVIGVTAPEPLVERWQTIKTYEEDQSAMQRIQSWGVAWNMAMERPLTGMGFRNTALGYDWWITYAEFEGGWRHVLSPHSIYFGLLGQHGFGGLAVYLFLGAFTFLTLNRVRRTAKRRTGKIWLSEYAWALQVGLAGYFIAGIFLDVAYFNLYYAFIAMSVIMRRELEEAPKPAEATVPTPAQPLPQDTRPSLSNPSLGARSGVERR